MMSQKYILTIDQGTSSCKTALWTYDGNLLAHASEAYALKHPHPLYAEMDARVWWDALCKITRAVVTQSNIHARDIAGIGVDGIGWTLAAVDKDCNPLYPALLWLDRRAEQEAKFLASLPEAADLVNLAANPLDPAYITPKLLWLQKNHPRVFDAARYFLTASGFLVAQLTGEFYCDYTQAYGYHFFDMRRARWDESMARHLEIPLEKLPRLASCAEIAGTLTARAAEQMGLRPDIPVSVGCLDAAAGALGAGVTRVGQTNEQGGQAGGMAISVPNVIVAPRLIFSHHVLPRQYLLQGGTVGGGSLSWFRRMLEQDEDAASFEALSAQAAQAPPGANGVIFIPYMAGERTPLWNRNARGIFFGLSYATTRADMVRALMEGCAFAVFHNVRVAAEQGIVIDEYLGSGGATASATWCQIKADVYGKPFVVARRADGGEGGHALGLFALTARAIGLRDDVGACIENLLSQRRVYEPNLENHARYQEWFEIYLRVSQKLLPEFDALAQVMK